MHGRPAGGTEQSDRAHACLNGARMHENDYVRCTLRDVDVVFAFVPCEPARTRPVGPTVEKQENKAEACTCTQRLVNAVAARKMECTHLCHPCVGIADVEQAARGLTACSAEALKAPLRCQSYPRRGC